MTGRRPAGQPDETLYAAASQNRGARHPDYCRVVDTRQTAADSSERIAAMKRSRPPPTNAIATKESFPRERPPLDRRQRNGARGRGTNDCVRGKGSPGVAVRRHPDVAVAVVSGEAPGRDEFAVLNSGRPLPTRPVKQVRDLGRRDNTTAVRVGSKVHGGLEPRLLDVQADDVHQLEPLPRRQVAGRRETGHLNALKTEPPISGSVQDVRVDEPRGRAPIGLIDKLHDAMISDCLDERAGVHLTSEQ